ncbi:hypothetical protein [Comamonas testosteroni]|uniref:hypothetical protein n=1 Tax=Comamonas testosteroni TaxID=285 RepID=UPI002E13FEB1|nr:hypothetical protein U0024_14970 [Comamonas testosteroni]
MKSIWCAGLMALMTVTGLAHAIDDPVPPDTKLTQLPEGSRLVTLRDIDLDNDGDGSSNVYSLKLPGGWFSEMRNEPTRVPKGTIYRIDRVNENGSMTIRPTTYALPKDKYGVITFKGKAQVGSRTVRDLNRVIDGNMKIIFNDPLSEIDPAIAQDILLSKITANIADGKFAEALPGFERIERLGAELPESFYFYYIQALDKSDKKDEARTRSLTYLKKYGKAGQYYNQVVEVMSR